MLGKVPTMDPKLSGDFETFIKWADGYRKLGIKTNADTPKDCSLARELGAEGVGLCRTEHMFFEGDRIKAVREMILAETDEGRRKAINKLLPYQKVDFIGIFEAMEGLPVTVRLLDPPLHEFLPKSERDYEELAKDMGVLVMELKAQAQALHEFNPMLGHRGCRLGMTFPAIYEMQIRAIFEAACHLLKKGVAVKPEVMIPLVAHPEEMRRSREMVVRVAADVMKREGQRVAYTVGSMIELPRAAITADKIAEHSDFFSFGTNDLTQTTFGLSRDDSGRFLPHYVQTGILDTDPFVSIDREGVGEFIKIGIARGRSVKPGLKVGICGEHGGEPRSVAFCHETGFDYVSCSPYRIPIARLAAAQAAIGAPAPKKTAKEPKAAPAKRPARKPASTKPVKKRRR